MAQQAGVSLKTVSRVVNHEAGVTPALQEQVQAAIRSLDYRPDDRARALRRQSTGSRTIGFVPTDVANPFFSGVFRGLEDEAAEQGYLVLAGSSDADPRREEALVRAFVGRRVEGLVIASANPDLSYLKAELEHGTPAVFVDLEPAETMGDVVRSDHYGGAALATRHLLEYGHRRVAYLGDRQALFSSAERRRAFVDVMSARGLDTPWIVTGLTTPSEAQIAAEQILRATTRPTALLAAQNYAAMGAVRALQRAGLQHEIALVGIDDADFAELVDPKISVVPQDPIELGRLTAQCLFSRLAAPDAAPTQLILNTRLIERGSGEIPPDAAGRA
ncbi:MAG: LacI family DNA-binding transcriptional regulator [Actinomycetota bacterium]